MAQVVDGKEQPLGMEAADEIWNSLVANGILAADGKIQPKFDPKKDGFTLNLPESHKALESQIVDVLSNYQLERHIRDNRKEGLNKLKKAVQLSQDFEALWERIKPRTTYQVEFTTDDLVHRAVQAIRKMQKVEAAKVNFITAELSVTNAGVEAHSVRVEEHGWLPQ